MNIFHMSLFQGTYTAKEVQGMISVLMRSKQYCDEQMALIQRLILKDRDTYNEDGMGEDV